MTEQYDPQQIEAKWQRVWEDERAFEVANPRPGAADARKSYVLEQLPYPSGDAAHGPHARLHDRRRRDPLPAPQRLSRAAPDGLRLVRPAGRERRDPRGRPPARDHRAQHRGDQALDAAHRLVDRLVARALDARPRRTTAGSSGSSCSSSSAASPTARARRSSGARTTRPCSRTSRCCRRALRALRRRGRVAADGAVVLPDHRLRAGAARRSRDTSTGPSRSRRGSATGSAAPRAPRSSSGSRSWDEDVAGLHDAPGHALRRDLLRARAGARARRADRLATRCASTSGSAAAKKTEERAAAEEKTGVFTGLHAVNPVNGERIPIYVADYVLTDYGTGAIMAVPAHDRARLRLRAGVRPAGPAGRPAGRRRGRRERAVRRAHGGRGARQLGRVRRAAGAGGRPQDRRAARARRARPLRGQLPPARLGLLAPALLGLPDPGRLLRRAAGSSRSPTSELPVVLPDVEDYKPQGQAAARAGRGLGERAPARRCGGPGAARDRDDGHVRRLVLVLPALLRPAATTRRRSTARSSTTGTRSTSTSAASTTRRCT